MKKYLFILLLTLPLLTHAQNITTIAGNGIHGYSGDNAPATAAQLYGPKDVVVDDTGNTYISDHINRCIRKVNSSGFITTVAGGGSTNGDNIPATDASIYVWGIAVDKKGNLFIADYSSNRIRKVDTNGIIHTIAGTTLAGYNGDGISATSAQLFFCTGVATDKFGRLYICDASNFRIRMIDTAGIIHTIAGTGIQGYNGDNIPATNAMLNGVSKICIDSDNNIYFPDGESRIRKIDSAGIISTIAGNGIFACSGDGGSATSANFYNAQGIAVDNSKNIYVADVTCNIVRKIDASGIINTVAGQYTAISLGDGGPATSASFNSPTGVAIDTSGNIFIADYGHCRIRKIYKHTDNIAQVNNPIDIFIAPNPTNGHCYLSFSTPPQFVDVSIIDILGRIVKQAHYNNTTEIELSLDVPDGIYLCATQTENGIKNTKLVVQR